MPIAAWAHPAHFGVPDCTSPERLRCSARTAVRAGLLAGVRALQALDAFLPIAITQILRATGLARARRADAPLDFPVSLGEFAIFV